VLQDDDFIGRFAYIVYSFSGDHFKTVAVLNKLKLYGNDKIYVHTHTHTRTHRNIYVHSIKITFRLTHTHTQARAVDRF